jgi:uncharacterized protein
MRINVDHIPQGGMTAVYSPSADQFPVLKQMCQDGDAGFSLPIQVNVTVRRFGPIVRADASIDTRAELGCSRCLKLFSFPIAADCSLTYTPKATPEPADDSQSENDESGEQTDMLTYDGQEVDLTDAVQEQIVLALPMQPLCDPACKGLCPGCGADLNTQTCTCIPAVSDSPFAALKKLRPLKK